MVQLTGNGTIDSLIWGGWTWEDGRIDYFFSNRASDWTTKEKQAYRAALQAWANVADIDARQVSRKSDADFVEYTVGNRFFGEPGVGGVHETPPDANRSNGQAEGFYNYQEYGAPIGEGYVPSSLNRGGYAFTVIMHELGHGLGLAHPHDRGGKSGKLPGVNSAFDDFGDNNLNQGVFTVMSYNDGWSRGQSPFDSGTISYGYSSGPGALDIAAVQAIYGANLGHKSRDTTYRIKDKGAWMSIWDTGGTDTIEYDGKGDAVINLTSATLDNSSTGGGKLSFVKNGAGKKYYGGYTIAGDFTDALSNRAGETGVIIENATGGSGDDMLTGNRVDNRLSGRGGMDTINGNVGNDRLAGGSGNDQISGEKGADTLTGGAGSDVLQGGPGADRFDFNNPADSGNGLNQMDEIVRFDGARDVIDLSDIDAKTGAGNQAFSFIGTSQFSGTKGELRYRKTFNATIIQTDRDGDGQADMEILLDTRMNLQADDFIL